MVESEDAKGRISVKDAQDKKGGVRRIKE